MCDFEKVPPDKLCPSAKRVRVRVGVRVRVRVRVMVRVRVRVRVGVKVGVKVGLRTTRGASGLLSTSVSELT